jgi:hypothetical protein
VYQLNYPIKSGLIDNWNNMEKLWQRCFYDYLRVDRRAANDPCGSRYRPLFRCSAKTVNMQMR